MSEMPSKAEVKEAMEKFAGALHVLGDAFMKIGMAAEVTSQALTGMALIAECYVPDEERSDGK